jgi:hypothetical protein
MLCQYAECHSAECRVLLTVMLNVILMSAVAPTNLLLVLAESIKLWTFTTLAKNVFGP